MEDSKTTRSRNDQSDKDNIVKTLTLFSVLTTIVLQSCSRTFFIGLTPHLYHFLIYSLVEIGILIASNGLGNLICILLIKQYAILKQRLRVSYGVCAFLASVSCFLMAAPYFLSSDILNQNNSNTNITLKTQLNLKDEKIRNIFGIKNDSRQLPVFASHIGAQLLVGCVSFALTIAAETSKDVISLPSTLWNKVMFGMPIFGEALGYILAASVTHGESAWIHIYTTLGCAFLLLSIPILVIQDTDLQTPDAEEQAVLNHWLSKEKSISWMSLFSVRFCCVLAAATLSTYFLQTTAILLPVLIHIFYCMPLFTCVLIGEVVLLVESTRLKPLPMCKLRKQSCSITKLAEDVHPCSAYWCLLHCLLGIYCPELSSAVPLKPREGFIPAPIVVMTVLNSQISVNKFQHNLPMLQADACLTNPLWGFCIFMGATVAIAISLLLPFGFGCLSKWHSSTKD